MTWTETGRKAEALANRAEARGTQLTMVRVPDELPSPFEPGHGVVLRLAIPTGVHRHPCTVCRGEAGPLRSRS